MSSDEGKILIILSNRAPVRVCHDEWPIIAHATETRQERDGDPGTIARYKLYVRQHSDGRAIVYGSYALSSASRWARHYDAGLLSRSEEIPATIEAVATDLERLSDADPWDHQVFPGLARRCIASLPPVDL